MRFLFLTFLLFVTHLLTAQNPPMIRCAKDTTNNWIDVIWNNDHNCGADFISTNVFMSSNPFGPFTEVGSVTDPVGTNFIDESAAGFVGELFYYVEHECTGSTAVSDTISNLDPQPPTIVSVSVVDGDVLIIWEPGDFPDLFGTRVFRNINGGPVEIQSILGIDITQTVDTNASPSDMVETYDLSTLDGCSNTGSNTGLPHSTMRMFAEGDPCEGVLTFPWTGYVGWNNIVSYRLLKNGVEVDTSDPAIVPHTIDYILDGSDVGPTCFAIEGENDLGATSLSNEICFDFSEPELPEYIYMRNATALSQSEILVEWFIDETTMADRLILNRGLDIPSIDSHIDMGDIPYTAVMDTIDALVNTSTRAYYYNVSAADTCGAETPSGNVRTILLNAQDNFNSSNILDWNAFEIENGSVDSYNIYRSDDNFTTPIANVGSATLEYIDVLDDDAASTSGGLCYRVEALFDLDVPAPVGPVPGLSSWSWEACVVQNSRIFVPNVFAPNGVNKIFIPTIVFPNVDDYRMVIFNRWGEILFETNSPDVGWDGFNNGGLVPQGVYAYVIEMRSLNGIQLERKGTVLLMR